MLIVLMQNFNIQFIKLINIKNATNLEIGQQFKQILKVLGSEYT